MADLDKLHEAIIKGDANTAKEVAQAVADEKGNAREAIEKYMITAMAEVGRRFEANEYFVPEMLIAARAMKGALEILKPLLAEDDIEPKGRVAIGTVKGDLHDIGKNLVSSMLEGGGFEIIDLGVDVTPEKFTNAVKEKKANVIALSALLTTTMPAMKDVIQNLNKEGLREKVKVIIGGAPITQNYADEIGADGYSDTASSAVNIANKLLT
ncbi:MAG TPA: corrinoid protein [Spirochaetota bacterium]|nr:corrinoid protein [Spirochaetota bacterium]